MLNVIFTYEPILSTVQPSKYGFIYACTLHTMNEFSNKANSQHLWQRLLCPIDFVCIRSVYGRPQNRSAEAIVFVSVQVIGASSVQRSKFESEVEYALLLYKASANSMPEVEVSLLRHHRRHKYSGVALC